MFEGYIIKFGEEEFPVKYMAPSSYRITPEKKNIIDENEDSTGRIHPDILSHKRMIIRFNTKLGLHQADIEKIQRILQAGCINERAAQYEVTAWNPSVSKYKRIKGTLKDITYIMRKVDPVHKDIIYESATIEIEEN